MCENCCLHLYGFFLKVINISLLLVGLALIGYGAAEALELCYFGIGTALVACLGYYSLIGRKMGWLSLYMIISVLFFLALGALCIAVASDKDVVTKYMNEKMVLWIQEYPQIASIVLASAASLYLIQAAMAWQYKQHLPEKDEGLLAAEAERDETRIAMLDDSHKSNAFVHPKPSLTSSRGHSEIESVRDRLSKKYQAI